MINDGFAKNGYVLALYLPQMRWEDLQGLTIFADCSSRDRRAIFVEVVLDILIRER